MRHKTEQQVRSHYADLIAADADRATIRTIQDLDAGLKSVQPPAELWRMDWLPAHAQGQTQPDSVLPHTPRHIRECLDSLAKNDLARHNTRPRNRSRFQLSMLFAAAATACLVLLATVKVTAQPRAASVTNLGSPTNAVPPNNPVGEFRHTRTPLKAHGLPEVVFLGTLVDDNSAAERWPLVKALGQFGNLAGAEMTSNRRCEAYSPALARTAFRCYDPGQYPGLPTFDLSHVHYQSRYISFESHDLIDRSGVTHHLPAGVQEKLFNQYARVPGYSKWSDAVWQTALNNVSVFGNYTRGFPLLVVGNYLSTKSEVAIPGDLATADGRGIISFSAIQDSLKKGAPTGNKSTGPPPALIQDYNAEANVITAFICHADGRKPAAVCNRTVIRSLLKRIK